MQLTLALVTVVVSVAATAAFFVVLGKRKTETSTGKTIGDADVEGHQLVAEAKARAKEIVLEAKDEALKHQREADEALSRKRTEWTENEKRLAVQKAELETLGKQVDAKNESVEAFKASLEKKQSQIDQTYKEQQEKLQNIASLTKEEARSLLLSSFEKSLVEEKGKMLKVMEEDVKKEIDHMAQELLIDAMRYGATDYVVEHTVSRVKLPDEEIKGRIIGKEGRNIRAFEELTGTNLDLDSNQGEIVISCFDPVRREVAKVSLEKLIMDGRIQPVRIEEIVKKTQEEIDHVIYKEGDNLCHRVGVYDLPKELVQYLGRFKYRFSYGQNMIEHTLEETRIGVALANELGLDTNIVKMGCLLHDIGKVVTDEEGTHVQLGVDLLKKYKIADRIIACVAEHHEDRPFSSLESAAVNLADHISGARPGARSEDYESYLKRMKELENAAMSFDGVERVHAVSAGREVRVFVIPEKVDDASTRLLAREIAKKIELEQTYPGIVKVTVIRETRVSETAK